MSDWHDRLSPEERRDWDDWVRHVREGTVRQMTDSAFVLQLVPDGEPDVKFAVELGLSILLDKPILAVVRPGVAIPERLLRVADSVVVADLDTSEGQDQIRAEIATFQATWAP